MRELIVVDRENVSLRFTFNEANSELMIDDGENGVVVFEHEETSKLQNWFMSL